MPIPTRARNTDAILAMLLGPCSYMELQSGKRSNYLLRRLCIDVGANDSHCIDGGREGERNSASRYSAVGREARVGPFLRAATVSYSRCLEQTLHYIYLSIRRRRRRAAAAEGGKGKKEK